MSSLGSPVSVFPAVWPACRPYTVASSLCLILVMRFLFFPLCPFSSRLLYCSRPGVCLFCLPRLPRAEPSSLNACAFVGHISLPSSHGPYIFFRLFLRVFRLPPLGSLPDPFFGTSLAHSFASWSLSSSIPRPGCCLPVAGAAIHFCCRVSPALSTPPPAVSLFPPPGICPFPPRWLTFFPFAITLPLTDRLDRCPPLGPRIRCMSSLGFVLLAHSYFFFALSGSGVRASSDRAFLSLLSLSPTPGGEGPGAIRRSRALPLSLTRGPRGCPPALRVRTPFPPWVSRISLWFVAVRLWAPSGPFFAFGLLLFHFFPPSLPLRCRALCALRFPVGS